MRTLRFLLQKEFRQITRNKIILRMIFMMPVVQLLILPLVANYEVKDIHLAVVDYDHSTYSQRLIQQITATEYFTLATRPQTYKAALADIEHDRADLILEIPVHFEQTLIREDKAPIFMAINAVNGVKGGLAGAYLTNILRDFNNDIRLEWMQLPRNNPVPLFETRISNRFNPYQRYSDYIVPGILVLLVTMVGAFMTAMNIVREKEIGTIEQINVTPISKFHFILGKLIPFWVIGLIVLAIGMIVGFSAYRIWPVGSIPLIFLFASVYLIGVLGLGLLISSYADTQQQAMLMAFFFMMIFILMGGLYTSIESMPYWAQVITWFNPVAYFIDAMRMIVLKGSGFYDIQRHFAIVGCFAVFLNAWAILSYRKRA